MERGELVFLRPSEILFSEYEIAGRFADYGDIHQVILRLTLHPCLVNTVPTINVSNRNDGEWHTENNRRLYVFRVLERNGVVDKIQVNVLKRALFRLNVEDGCHVRVSGKGATTLPHCQCKHLA